MLYLQEPRQLGSPSPTEVAQAQSLLSKLYESITSVLIAGRSNQKEAKAWLLNAISGLDLRDAGLRRRKYGQFLPGGSAYDRTLDDFGKQLLQELFTDESRKVARLISEEPSVLKHFFRQDPGHVRLWFGHFSMNGMADFRHGAHALARYALLNRDEVWRLLVWAGKHPQAPVAVAQKTHYFCELDVAATVANLLDECPGFWESQELRDSMSSGQLLALAPTFWAEELYGWLKEFSRRSDRLFGLVCDYLESGADWRRLCGRLLPLLPPADLLAFASGLLTDVSLPAAPACSLSGTAALTSQNSAGAWLVFRGSAQWGSLEELVLAAALGCNLRQLGRLVREEENAEELQEMLGLAETLNSSETSAAHWLLRGQLARRAKQPQQAQASQPDAAEGSAQEPGAGTGGSTVAANTAAAGAGLGAAGACWEGIHGFLLLHLWAAYLHLSSLALSVSSSSGSSGSLKQLQQLVAELDISCEPAEAQQQESAPGRGAWVGVDEDPLLAQFEGARKSKRRRREKRLGKDKEGSGRQEGKKKGRAAKGSHKHRRRKRRHRSSDSSSPSDGSSPRAGDASESGGGGELSTGVGGSGKDGHQHGRSRHFRGLSGAEEEEGLGHALRSGGQGSWGGKSLWTVHTPGGAVTTMAAAELVEYAMEQLARAYIGWLVSQGL